MLVLEQAGIEAPKPCDCDLFIIPLGDAAKKEAVRIASGLLDGGMGAQYDLISRSVKAQMKYADKIGARATVVLGDSELEQGVVRIKRMADGEQAEISLSELDAKWLEEFLK